MQAAENDQKIKRGEQPQADEDLTKVFRPIPPPQRLDNVLVNAQISTYCTQLKQFASQSFAKLYTAEAIQSEGQQ